MVEQKLSNPCPKCGYAFSKNIYTLHDYLHNIGDYTISECQDCGFWFQSNRPKDTSMLYPVDFAQHKNVPPKAPKHNALITLLKHIKNITWSNKIGLVAKPVKNGRI